MNAPFTERPASGPASVLAYLGCSVLGLLPIGLVTATAMALQAWLAGEDLSALAQPQRALTGGVLFVSMASQFTGMLLLAVFLARVFRRDVRSALGLHRFPWVAALVAMLLTPTCGLFTARVSAWMVEHGLTFGTLDQLGDAVTGGSPLDQLLMGVAVIGFAPIVEELVFRGFFWDALSRAFPTWGVWLATSVIFAAYHTDPAHVVGVMGLSLFAGWTRWRTGSVWPAVGIHTVNNVLALSLQRLDSGNVPQSNPWWVAILGLFMAIGAAALVAVTASRGRRASGT